MKKTFVALAALAAVGAASAQVSLTGGYTFGYAKSGAVGGLYTDGASIKLTAVEDLGNGMSATAVVSAGGLVRKTTGSVGGEDASLTLAGGFGSVELASKETGHGTSSAWIAPGYGLDSTGGFGGGTPKDRVTFKAPAFGGLTLSASYTDRGAAAVAADAATVTPAVPAQLVGAGGTNGAKGSQPYAIVGAAYAVGGLSAGFSYTSFGSRDMAGAKSYGYTLSGSYDAQVVKIAAAYDKNNLQTASYAFGASAPLGAVTLGAQFGKTETGKKVLSGGVKYALSKSVDVTGSYRSTDGGTKDGRVLVTKSF